MSKLIRLGFLSTVLSKSFQPFAIVDVCSMDVDEASQESFPADGWSFTVDGEAFDGSEAIELNQPLQVIYNGDEIQSFSMQVRPVQSNAMVGEWTSDLKSEECSGIGSLEPVSEVSASWVQSAESTIGTTHRLVVSVEKDGLSWQRNVLFSFEVKDATEQPTNNTTTTDPTDDDEEESTTEPTGDDEITTADPDDSEENETTTGPNGEEETTSESTDEDGTTPADPNDNEDPTEPTGDDDEDPTPPAPTEPSGDEDEDTNTTSGSPSITLKLTLTTTILGLAKLF